MSRVASFVVLVAIILVFAALFYRVMSTFLLPLFFAAFLVVIFQPLHRWVVERCRGRRRVAAGVTAALILLSVLLPTAWLISFAVIEGFHLASDLNVASVKIRLRQIRQSIGAEMPAAGTFRSSETLLQQMVESARQGGQPQISSVRRLQRDVDTLADELGELAQPQQQQVQALRDALKQVSEAVNQDELSYEASLGELLHRFRALKLAVSGGPYLGYVKELANPTDEQLQTMLEKVVGEIRPLVLSVTGATTAWFVKLVIGAVITVVAVYFFLADGHKMLATIMRLSPLDDNYEQELFNEFVSVSRAVVLATLLSAAAQGVLAGLGYWLVGFESLFLLTLLTGVLAMVPFLGAASVWVPCCLWLYVVDNRSLAAALLAVYGAAIVSMADNVIKPIVLHGQSRLHPLLALLSVLGGIQALGPMGILVGPMVVVFLQTLLQMLHRELTHFDAATQASEPAEAAPDA